MHEDDEDGDQPAIGSENATPETVLKYLMHPKGGNLSEAKAREVAQQHVHLITKGQRLASFANYVGDQILREAGLPEGEGE